MLTLLLSVVLAAAPWPAKGDTVYVSATLTSFVNPVSGLFGPVTKGGESPVLACAPMLVTKLKPSATRLELKDPAGGYERLEGPWLPRVHESEESCRKVLEASGEPRVVRNGWVHRIIQ
jgi:hypothetical protein